MLLRDVGLRRSDVDGLGGILGDVLAGVDEVVEDEGLFRVLGDGEVGSVGVGGAVVGDEGGIDAVVGPAGG